jgi:hypothetical protein
MNILQAFKIGIGQFWQYRQMWLLVYLLTLVSAIFIAMPIKSYLESNAGNSLMVEDLIKGFDYTFLNDFMVNYGHGFSAITKQSVLVVGVFMLLMVFFVGGILNVYQKQPVQWDKAIFWGGAANYFWKMLRLTVYFLFIHTAVLVLFVFIYYALTNGFSVKEDTIIFTAWKWLLPIYILASAFFFMWHDYAKLMVVRSDKKWLFQSIIPAFKFIIQHFKSVYLLYLIHVGLLIFIYILNYIYTNSFEISTSSQIYLGFFISQLFILGRLAVRLVNWSSASVLYDNNAWNK